MGMGVSGNRLCGGTRCLHLVDGARPQGTGLVAKDFDGDWSRQPLRVLFPADWVHQPGCRPTRNEPFGLDAAGGVCPKRPGNYPVLHPPAGIAESLRAMLCACAGQLHLLPALRREPESAVSTLSSRDPSRRRFLPVLWARSRGDAARNPAANDDKARTARQSLAAPMERHQSLPLPPAGIHNSEATQEPGS
jgi:hypothetical protein